MPRAPVAENLPPQPEQLPLPADGRGTPAVAKSSSYIGEAKSSAQPLSAQVHFPGDAPTVGFTRLADIIGQGTFDGLSESEIASVARPPTLSSWEASSAAPAPIVLPAMAEGFDSAEVDYDNFDSCDEGVDGDLAEKKASKRPQTPEPLLAAQFQYNEDPNWTPAGPLPSGWHYRRGERGDRQ